MKTYEEILKDNGYKGDEMLMNSETGSVDTAENWALEYESGMFEEDDEENDFSNLIEVERYQPIMGWSEKGKKSLLREINKNFTTKKNSLCEEDYDEYLEEAKDSYGKLEKRDDVTICICGFDHLGPGGRYKNILHFDEFDFIWGEEEKAEEGEERWVKKI